MNKILKQTDGKKLLGFIVVPLVFVAGIATIAQALADRDQKQHMRDVYTKGNYLVSLIATHPISKLDYNRREFVLKTLAKFTYPEGVAYCIIHDETGHPVR